MRIWQLAILITAISVSLRASSVDSTQGLPSESSARTVLNSTPRHREWVNVTFGSDAVLAFVVYPERADKAPVAIVTEKNDGATTWVRAVADQVAAHGFIAVVPDVSGKAGSSERKRQIDAVRTYAVALPAATGESRDMEFDRPM